MCVYKYGPIFLMAILCTLHFVSIQTATSPTPTGEPSSHTDPTPEPTSEPKPEPTSEPKPEPTSEPTSEPKPEPKPEPPTKDSLKEHCEILIRNYAIRRQEHKIPAACHKYQQFQNVTVTDVIQSMKNTSSTIETIHRIIRHPSFPSNLMSDLVSALITEKSAIPSKIFTVGVEAIVDRAYHFKVPRVLHLIDVEFLQDLVMSLPGFLINRMAYDTFDFMLQHISNMTASLQDTPIDVITQNILDDPSRHSALCTKAFSLKKSLNSTSLNKVFFLMNCAPTPVCAALTVNATVANKERLLTVPWKVSCAYDMLTRSEKAKLKSYNLRGLLQRGSGCAREISRKFTEGLFNASNWNEVEVLGPIFSCLSYNDVKRVFSQVDCADAEAGLLAMNHTMSQWMINIVAHRCILPKIHPSNVTCSQLTNYKSFLTSFPYGFMMSIPEDVICENNCQKEIFAGFGNLKMPKSIKFGVMKKCRPTGPLDSAAVLRLGAMVVKLPMKSVKSMSAADLGTVLTEVKKSLKTDMKKDPRKRAVLRSMARKLVESGSVRDIVDNKEFMKQLSLKDLNAVQNVTELFTSSATLDLPDSQNKFFMKKVLNEKNITALTPTDVRQMKSLVKGLLSKEIDRFDPSKRMEIATALCEQTNWPLKTGHAINRKLIVQSLTDKMSSAPMSVFSAIDVDTLGCECLIHFKPAELEAMPYEACQATCTAIGSCSKFQCLNPDYRRGVLKSCLSCMNATSTELTPDEVSSLGPNLLQQLSPVDFNAKIPSSMISDVLGFFQGGCLSMDLRASLKSKILSGIGETSTFNSATFEGLKELVMIFSDTERDSMDMSAFNDVTSKILEVLNPEEEADIQARQCCERWLSDADKADLKTSIRGLYTTIMKAKRAVMSTAPSRKKRSIVTWTCNEIQSVGPAFVDATIADLEAISDAEFSSCVNHLGSLSGWTMTQLATLYNRTEQLLGNSCNMTTDDIVDMGGIALGMTVTDIQCLNLTSDDVVIALGNPSTWSSAQLIALADAFKATRNTSVSSLSSGDLTNLRHILCGYLSTELSDLNATSLGASGSQMGALSYEACSISHIQVLTAVAADPLAYGPSSSWDASILSEIGILAAGLSGDNLANLTVSAIEGIAATVIPVFPTSAISTMTVDQLASFSSAQAVAVTASQRSAMSLEQQNSVQVAAFGDFAETVTIATPPGSGTDETFPETLQITLSVIMGFMCLCLFIPI